MPPSSEVPRIPLIHALIWHLGFAFSLLALVLSNSAVAQNQPGGGNVKQYPSQEYYLAATHLENGELEEALAGFRESLQRAWRVGNIRFVDSIAPQVMAGECYYQQGNLTLALQQYEIALALQVELTGWSSRLNSNNQGGVAATNPQPTVRGIQWGSNTRGTTLVSLPKFVPCMVGQVDTLEAARRGGVIIPAELIRIDIGEVLRTLALAQYRRNQILGSLAPRYPLTASFRTAIQAEPGSGIPWIDACFRVNQGLAELPQGDPARAAQLMAAAQSTPDRIDHPCTAIALLAQADIQLSEDNLPVAGQLLLESSLVAAQMEQYMLLCDISTRLGTAACLLGDGTQVNVLQSIANFCRKQRRAPTCFALAAASELAIVVGNANSSETIGKTALSIARGRGVFLPRVISQVAYASAQTEFARGRIASGNESMTTAMAFYRGSKATGISSVLQYQLAQTLDMHRRDVLPIDDTKRNIERLLGEYPDFWTIEPLEALSMLQTDQSEVWSLYDGLNLRRTAQDEFPDILEQRARRHFYTALPWKHRLLAVRQLILLPEEALTPAQMNLRKQLNLRIPEVSVEAKRLKEILPLIQQQKIAWERIEHPKNELQQYKDMENASLKLEAMFHLLAISRVALPEFIAGGSEIVKLRAKLESTQAVLRFVLVPGDKGERIDVYFITKKSIERFEIGPSIDAKTKLVKLLTTLGLGSDKNRKLVVDDFKLWQEAAAELKSMLFPEELNIALKEYDQLVIVPEGWIWYVPLGALPEAESDGARWSEQCEIAYAPLLSHALNCLGATSRSEQLAAQQKIKADATWEGAVWDNAFFGGLDEDDEAKKLVAFETEIAGVKILQPIKEIIPPALYRTRPQMLLAACRKVDGPTPLSSAWFEQDKAKSRLTWNDALATPQLLPETLLLPGWNTSAGTLNLGNGDDLFFPAVTLFISGSKQSLLHRWGGGGTASHSLLKRFLLEWNDVAPLPAWQRSLTALAAEEFSPSQEDVFKGADFGQALVPGAHAALWSGYVPLGKWLTAKKKE
jgi:tetratricopeptide (TPR) repeat protein